MHKHQRRRSNKSTPRAHLTSGPWLFQAKACPRHNTCARAAPPGRGLETRPDGPLTRTGFSSAAEGGGLRPPTWAATPRSDVRKPSRALGRRAEQAAGSRPAAVTSRHRPGRAGGGPPGPRPQRSAGPGASLRCLRRVWSPLPSPPPPVHHGFRNQAVRPCRVLFVYRLGLGEENRYQARDSHRRRADGRRHRPGEPPSERQHIPLALLRVAR